MIVTRRKACALMATVLGVSVLGLSGCSSSGGAEADSHSSAGYAGDGEVKDYPVFIRLYADSNIQWMPGGSAAVAALGWEGLNHLEEYATRYRSEAGRSEVSFDFVFVDPPELLEMARNGFDDGDGLLALAETVTAGNDAGVVDGGTGGYLARGMSYNFPERVVMVRAVGSAAELPAAQTIDGNDSDDGQFNRLQQLPQYEGLVAVVSDDATTEGWKANTALAREDFYSESGGRAGEYAESVVDKLRFYPDQDAAMAAVSSGECALGFAIRSHVGTRYPQVETWYEPRGSRSVEYSAAALSRSAEPGVVRDFFEFILRCTD